MNHPDAFEKMKILIGDWRVTHDHGRISTVNYRMSCNNTVLVETWALKPDMESLTLFHMDGSQFMATHYCPLGNQPRLHFSGGNSGKLRFETQSVTNLASKAEEHCQAVEFRLVGEDKVERSETYVTDGVPATEFGVFSRIA